MSTMTFSQGLFDIEVPIDGGTSDANGIVHSGTTGGPRTPSVSDNHTIYMVAVPKNQAVTMLLGGSIGFAPAAAGATVANGQIYLFSGSVFNGGGTSSGSPGTGSINIGAPGATTITSAVFGDADGSILVGAITGNISFSGGEVVLEADPFDGTGDIKLLADNGHTLSFADDATMFDDVLLIAGNTIEISADHGGAITVAGGSTLTRKA